VDSQAVEDERAGKPAILVILLLAQQIDRVTPAAALQTAENFRLLPAAERIFRLPQKRVEFAFILRRRLVLVRRIFVRRILWGCRGRSLRGVLLNNGVDDANFRHGNSPLRGLPAPRVFMHAAALAAPSHTMCDCRARGHVCS
jgi:hypothetical protein